MTIALRPVCEGDDPFLLELYTSARELEMSLVPWTAEQKHEFLESQFAAQKLHYATVNPQATHDIICVDGQRVGRVYLARRPGRFHILDITIAPARRNAGIGTEILKSILEEADREGKPASIYVESFNPAALRFFERLGFKVASTDGFLVLLERPAGGSAA